MDEKKQFCEGESPPGKKPLSSAGGVQAACILFDINTNPAGIIRLALRAGLDEVVNSAGLQQKMCAEWMAFVHATVTAGLMLHAPNSVLAAYLRQTKPLLHTKLNFSDAETEDFVDTAFSAYMDAMAKEKQRTCPDLFFRRMFGHELPKKHSGAVIASTMAMTVAAIFDRLEGYEISSD